MRLENNTLKILRTFEKKGLARVIPHETTIRIDRRIADAFEKASKETEKRQRQSWAIMEHRIWK